MHAWVLLYHYDFSKDVALSHLRFKEFAGIHKQYLFPIPISVHLKVDQRIQRNNSSGMHTSLHLTVSRESYFFELFDLSFDLKLDPFFEGIQNL